MQTFFQKKYIKIPIVAVLIFSLLSQSLVSLQRPKTVKAASKINYLDICEPKVPFYNEPLQTEKLQEACYLLKKIQDKASQQVDTAREIYKLTDPLTKCNPLWGETFPYITEGNCKSACAWSLPEIKIEIDLTLALVCLFAPPACAGDVSAIQKVLDLISEIYKWLRILKTLTEVINLIKEAIEVYQKVQEFAEEIGELIETVRGIDLSQVQEFYDTLSELIRLQAEIQNEIIKISGKICQMKNKVGVFSENQLKGIYRLINEIGEILANNILKPGQPPDPENGEERPFIEKKLKEIKEAADHLTCGEHCDNIKKLATSSIAKNDEIQQILYDFYQTGEKEMLGTAMTGLVEVICQTKDKISGILSDLEKLEAEIAQASDSDNLDIIQTGINDIKPI